MNWNEKKILLLLLLHIKENVYNDLESDEPGILLLPFERLFLKIDELMSYYIYNPITVRPEHLTLMIYHFQNFKNLSADSSFTFRVWDLIEFLLFRFPDHHSVDRILSTIFSFLEDVRISENLN